MKNTFVGIAIDGVNIYGAVGYKSKNVVQIDDAFTLACEEGIISDCNHFIARFGLEHERIGITYNCESAIKVIPVPNLEESEIINNLHLQVHEYINWPEDTYFYDYMQVSTDLTKLLYIVALNKKVVHHLSEGIIKANGNLRIIDYWPAPIMYLYKRDELVVVFDETIALMHKNEEDCTKENNVNNSMMVYAYVKGICIFSACIKRSPVAIAHCLEEIKEKAISYGFDNAIKLANPNTIHFLGAEEQEEWAAICATYESATERLYTLSGRAADVVNMNEKSWQVAVGLIMRSIYESKN